MPTSQNLFRLKIENPPLDKNPKTYMTADTDAAGTTVAVLSTTGFITYATGSISAFADGGGGIVTVTSAAHGLLQGQEVTITGTTNYNGTFEVFSITTNTFGITDTWVSDDGTGTWKRSGDYYIIVGNYGQEGNEIRLVDVSDAATDADSFKVDALVYAHSSSEPVTFTLYNQIQIYGLTTSGGTKTLIDTIDIDTTQQYTDYTYDGTTYDIFVFAYYNENDDEISDYSEEITSNTYDRRSSRRIIEAGLRKAMTSIDESKDSVLSWDIAIGILNDGLDEIMVRKRKWLFLHTISSGTTTTADTAYIDKPSGISILEHLIVDDYTLNWMPRLQYDDYTKNGATASTGNPSHYTLKNNKYYLYPTPSSALDIIYEFFKYPSEIDNLTDAINREFTSTLVHYCAAHFSYIRGNNARGDKMYALFSKILEQQCEEFSGPDQLGEGETISRVSSIFADDESLL